MFPDTQEILSKLDFNPLVLALVNGSVEVT